MHENTKLSQDFIKSWKKGWPEYIHMPDQDHEPIMSIARECARLAQVELDEEAGFLRVLKGINKIAEFCRSSKRWRSDNLYQINKALQSVLQQMMGKRWDNEEEERENSLATRIYDESKIRREKREQELREASEKSKQWAENEMTKEEEAAYEKWMRSIKPGRVISIDQGRDQDMNKAL